MFYSPLEVSAHFESRPRSQVWLGTEHMDKQRRRFPQTNVVFTTYLVLHLIGHLSGIKLSIIGESLQTSAVSPGTPFIPRTSDFESSFSPLPHCGGLYATLQLAKELLLDVPKDVMILAG